MQVLGLITMIIWCALIPLTLLYRMIKKREFLNPKVPRWSFTTSVFEDVDNPDAKKSVSVTFKLETSEYMKAAEAVSKAEILAFGQELGFQLDDARGIHEDDGRRGISWEIGDLETEDLTRRAEASGGCVKHKYFERYLKEGLRCIAELEDADLLDFRGLYRDTVPTAWWFELFGYSSRILYSGIMILNQDHQEVVGALLSGFLVALTAYVRPYRRRSDTLMQMSANIALLGFFVVHNRVFRGRQVSIICLSFPMLILLFWVVKAYILPSRKKLWSEEQALLGFESEFRRQWLAEKSGDEHSSMAVLRGSRARHSIDSEVRATIRGSSVSGTDSETSPSASQAQDSARD